MTNPFVDTLVGPSLLDFGHDNHITYYLDNSGSRSWTSAEAASFARALATWANVANITFERVDDESEADLVETLRTTAEMEQAYGQGVVGVHELPFFGTSYGEFDADGADNYYGIGFGSSSEGSYAFLTLVHELGHALGLHHPHPDVEGDPAFPGVIDPFDTGDNGLNQTVYTAMSYNDARDLPFFSFNSLIAGNVASPMAFDIAAIQQMYGANTTANSGDTVYEIDGLSPIVDTWQCIWDTGGTDTISYGGILAVAIDLRAATLLNEPGGGGFLSHVDISLWDGFTIANGVVIENATGGSANDTLVGNDAANVLDGRGGRDTMSGGAGNDTYGVDHALDVIIETTGIDTVRASISYVLGQDLENLTLVGNADNATGNSAVNTLVGNDRANILDGQAGADLMEGGGGNDTFIVDEVGDTVSDSSGAADEVQASVTFTLADGLERLILTGSSAIDGTGNGGDNVLIGNAAVNTLTGGDGNDTLHGSTTAGIGDILNGGDGDDTYILSPASGLDQIIDSSGIDTVVSEVTFVLSAGLDNLTLAGTAAIEGTGTDTANILTGNEAANVLDGGEGGDILIGGGGLDRLIGGFGNDIYDLADGFDIIEELDGTDSIRSSISRSLLDYASIEHLVLTGSANADATGSDADNEIRGNDGDNIIDGRGGADFMAGGNGDDTYVLSESGDFISEQAEGGTDTVKALFSFGFSDFNASQFVEIGVLMGDADLDITGGITGNSLFGNAGANTIDGGAGADIMHGFGGNDTYIVDHVSDVAFESDWTVAGGIDTVIASVAFTLGDGLENLTLTEAAGSAAISGNGRSNILIGNSFDNVINGGAGGDTMRGGAGNDQYTVYMPTDVIEETLAGLAGGVDVARSYVTYTLSANVEHLQLLGSFAINGAGNELANTLTGNGAVNRLSGLDGSDILSGLAGNDTLLGGAGLDVLTGGSGRDFLTGGSDRDIFDFNAISETGRSSTTRDRITDFQHLVDDIDLSTIDANGGLSGDPAFSFLATKGAAFTGKAAQLRWVQVNVSGTASDKTIVEGDINGDKRADFQIELAGLKVLTKGDFIL